MNIRFGTDGWRGIIAEEFTFAALAQVSATSAHILANTYGGDEFLIGYDHRFLAERFAQCAAQTLVAQGYRVLLADGPSPTPAISWAVKHRQATAGLVLTASHNPANYLGLKLKGRFGGSVTEQVTDQIEAQLNIPLPQKAPGTQGGFDPWADYLIQLRTLIDVERIKDQTGVYLDAMYGVGGTGLSRLGILCPVLRGERDPLFGGIHPEPISQYLAPAIATAKAQQALVLVFDGDADRIAAINPDGTYMNSQVLIPLLIDHLVKKGRTGAVVKTLSGSDLIRRLAQARGLKVYETAIGFKYIAEIMEQETVLLGGEESGGIGYGGHMPERDALLSALLILEIVAEVGPDLLAQYRALCTEFAFSPYYDRVDVKLPSAAFKQSLIERLAAYPPQEIAGQAVTEHIDRDGHKFYLADGRWLLIRFSGTEPLLRIYCEAPDPQLVQETLIWGKTWALS